MVRAALGVGVVAAVAALGALRPQAVLEVANPERGLFLALPLEEGQPFAVIAQSSLYDAPWSEEYQGRAGGGLMLRAVSSPSAAVREYLGLTGEGERQVVERPLAELAFRVAMGTPQRLRIGGVERSFLELGAPGDRLVLRAGRRSLLSRLLSTTGPRAVAPSP